jgi:hypothetical protein
MKTPHTMLALGVLLALPSVSLAFCRTTTCAQQDPPPECVPGVTVGTCQTSGLPLYWSKPCVSFSVQKDGSKKPGHEISADLLESIVRTCFDNWQGISAQGVDLWHGVACPGGGKPNMAVETYPQVECNESRYNTSQPNQNVYLFRDDAWPHEGSGERTIALTLVSFSPKTGEIYDVDTELNSFARNFTTETTAAADGDDLQSVIQHESGHFLGLAHSDFKAATMYLNYVSGTDMRSLETDDIDGICEIYPPVAAPDSTCNADPRHGFSTACATEDKGCSCTVVGSGGTRSAAALLAAVLGLLLTSSQLRRKRS